jgi:phosphatidylcholine synthase
VTLHQVEDDDNARRQEPVTRSSAAAAFGVHVFTATGAALGLLALDAAVRRDFALMFTWLGIALVVDGVDGTIARRLDVARRLPRWSGEALDLVVDFVTYVLVPAYALMISGLLPPPVAMPCAIIIVVTSALYFADREMKTKDDYFRGFPAVWNTVAFYIFLLAPNGWLSAAVIVGLSALVFAPLVFVHPFRVRRLMGLNIGLIVLWSLLAGIALWRDLAPPAPVVWALVAIGIYFLTAGFVRRPSGQVLADKAQRSGDEV